MKKLFGLLSLLVLLFAACAEEKEEPTKKDLPTITLDEASGRYHVKKGKDLTIRPVYGNVDEQTQYTWKMNGKVVASTPTLVFNQAETGEYFLTISVTNGGGTTQDEIKITVLELEAPFISLNIPADGYKIASNTALNLAPQVENAANATFQWTVNGTVKATTKDFEFKVANLGTYTVVFLAKNEDGEDSVTIPVQVCSAADLPFSWAFPWESINIAKGRDIKVKAYLIENDFYGMYTWTLDDKQVQAPAKRDGDVAYVFHADKEGDHTLTLEMKNAYGNHKQTFQIHVCPVAGTYQRAASSVSKNNIDQCYAYVPAPGHQVNGYSYGADFGSGWSQEKANAHALSLLQGDGSISLGAQGGYVIVGFDHSVKNSGGYDLAVAGNPYSYQSEPGIVWVSQDENGDGLPNDTWYELAGSEYGTANCTFEYAITYYKPQKAQSAVTWTDNMGGTNMVPYMAEWNKKDYYWQDWIPGSKMTYFGTRLADQSTFANGTSTIPPYAWGYADNAGSDYMEGKAGTAIYLKISNAKTWDHKDAHLDYIDFVKVQTAQTGWTPNLGEISTEVHRIIDLNITQ